MRWSYAREWPGPSLGLSSIALGDPRADKSPSGGEEEEEEEEGVGDATPAKIRNALTLYRPLNKLENVEIRMHQTLLYNSIYHTGDQLLVHQHAYGIPAAHTPVFCLRDTPGGEMAALYLGSFERVWARAASHA